MKRSKKDRLYWIQFDQTNRDFLINNSAFMLMFTISVVSLLISVIAVIISLEGITKYSIGVIIAFGIIIISLTSWCSKRVRKIMKNADLINNQLQNELLKVYPEYQKKYR